MKTVGTTILIEEERMKDLRSIARADRRSLGFVIRDAINFWLAAHRRQAVEAENQTPEHQS